MAYENVVDITPEAPPILTMIESVTTGTGDDGRLLVSGWIS